MLNTTIQYTTLAHARSLSQLPPPHHHPLPLSPWKALPGCGRRPGWVQGAKRYGPKSNWIEAGLWMVNFKNWQLDKHQQLKMIIPAKCHQFSGNLSVFTLGISWLPSSHVLEHGDSCHFCEYLEICFLLLQSIATPSPIHGILFGAWFDSWCFSATFNRINMHNQQPTTNLLCSKAQSVPQLLFIWQSWQQRL